MPGFLHFALQLIKKHCLVSLLARLHCIFKFSDGTHHQTKFNLQRDQFSLSPCVAQGLNIFTPEKGDSTQARFKFQIWQVTKKFRSDSPGLVDFVVGLVEFILHLPDGQVKVFGEIFL